MCEWRNKKRSKAAEACLKYSGPGGIQTAKPNAAALHLVWQYGGDAARRRSRSAKFWILTAFSLIFGVIKKKRKIIPLRDLNQRAKTPKEFAPWWKLLIPLAKIATVKPPVANMYVSVNSFLVNCQNFKFWNHNFYCEFSKSATVNRFGIQKWCLYVFLYSNSDIRISRNSRTEKNWNPP